MPNRDNEPATDPKRDEDLFSTTEFIRVWNGADSPDEVARHFIMSSQTASNKASRLRRQGHFLKYFRPTSREHAISIHSVIELEPSDLALAMRIGKGDVGEGIRKALRLYQEVARKLKAKGGSE
jgi:hypothetical protein